KRPAKTESVLYRATSRYKRQLLVKLATDQDHLEKIKFWQTCPQGFQKEEASAKESSIAFKRRPISDDKRKKDWILCKEESTISTWTKKSKIVTSLPGPLVNENGKTYPFTVADLQQIIDSERANLKETEAKVTQVLVKELDIELVERHGLDQLTLKTLMKQLERNKERTASNILKWKQYTVESDTRSFLQKVFKARTSARWSLFKAMQKLEISHDVSSNSENRNTYEEDKTREGRGKKKLCKRLLYRRDVFELQQILGCRQGTESMY
ncbi:4001_t:CDS:2, partial [Gigaspora rosea]